MDKLLAIQSELKAPKDLKNTFGGYHYRSCESILESLKPLLKAHGLVLTLCDDIVAVGTRIYVKATAALSDVDGTTGSKWTVTAFAREEETKKGMDCSQITGAASSYARKYALNGLFLIDDTKDVDTDEQHKQVDDLAEKAAQAKAKYNADKVSNPAHTNMGALAPKDGPKTPPAQAQATQEGVKLLTALVSYAKPVNSYGWQSYVLDGQQLDNGKEKLFQSKDPSIQALMNGAIQSGHRVELSYTETPWEKGDKHGINIAIVEAKEEASVPF
jgi:predicted house-cleaning NTP pyrophosphatase (Maf/HAM1 superfamily)